MIAIIVVVFTLVLVNMAFCLTLSTLDLFTNLIPMEVNILVLKFMNIPLLVIGMDLKLAIVFDK